LAPTPNGRYWRTKLVPTMVSRIHNVKEQVTPYYYHKQVGHVNR